MKSRASFYNCKIGKNLLKRYWPVWASYFFLLIASLPMNIAGVNYDNWADPLSINYVVLSSGTMLAMASFIISALVVMAMFGYLYNSRSCGMMNSLPVRRETMFMTVCVTGLGMMLLADLLTFGITALLFIGDEYIKLKYLVLWLVIVALGNTAFYGMAVFCAMLTGNIVVLPMVYGVLNLTAVVVETAVKSLMHVFLYGFSESRLKAGFLSPVSQVYKSVRVYQAQDTNNMHFIKGEYTVAGFKWLVIYCVVGLLLIGAALLLYRRRRMETAGDTVAVQILKPIFKGCMCFGTAIVFAVFVCDSINPAIYFGKATGLFATVMLMIGAAVGCIAAEMIMQRSLRVFRRCVKSCVIAVLIAAAVGLLCEFDVTGFETRVPEADMVESVSIESADGLEDRENIEELIALHRQIIGEKAANERLRSSGRPNRTLCLTYHMADGGTMSRMYEIDVSDEALKDSTSTAQRVQMIMNSAEAVRLRTSFSFPVTKNNIFWLNINGQRRISDTERRSDNLSLEGEDAYKLYSECILRDIEEGHLGKWYIANDEEYFDTKTNVMIDMQLVEGEIASNGSRSFSSITFNVQVDSSRCLKWLEENTDFEVMSLREVENEYGKQ